MDARSSRRRRLAISFERCEDRLLLTSDLILDFDGGVLQSGQGYTLDSDDFAGFNYGGFSAFEESDSTPGDLNEQILQILAGVREDYAAFDVRVIFDNTGVNSTFFDAVDTVVMIVSQNFSDIPNQTGEPFGFASRADNAQFFGTHGADPELAQTRDTAFAFLPPHLDLPSAGNRLARAQLRELIDTISHEAGHTFGLSHQIEADSLDRAIVTTAGQDRELDSRFSTEVLDHDTENGAPRAYSEVDRLTATVGASAIPPNDDRTGQTLPGDTTAVPLTAGFAASTGMINFLGDRDAFRFVAPSTGRYTIRQRAAGGSALQAAVTLWDRQGDFIAAGGGGVVSTITFNAISGRTYFAVAGSTFDRQAGFSPAERTTGAYSVEIGPESIEFNPVTGELTISGDATGNRITIDLDGPILRVDVDGIESRFAEAAVMRIAINSLGGDDRITIIGDLGRPTSIDGGDGFGDRLTIVGDGDDALNYLPSPSAGAGTFVLNSSSIAFVGVEEAFTSDLSDLSVTTPNSDDVVFIDRPIDDQNRIGGLSGGVSFTGLSFFDVDTVVLDTGANDGASADDLIFIDFDGLVARGLRNLTINTGAGGDLLRILAGLDLPVAGGRFTYNAGGPAGPGEGGDNLAIFGQGTEVGSYNPDGATARAGTIVQDGATIFFTDVEDALVSAMAEFRIVTPDSGDTLLIVPTVLNQNRISGDVGGVEISRLTFQGIAEFTVDAASNQTDATVGDSITIDNPGGAALIAFGLRRFAVVTGPGNDALTINSVDLRLPGGRTFSFDAGTGTRPGGDPASNLRGLISLDRVVLNTNRDTTLFDIGRRADDDTVGRARLSIKAGGEGIDTLGSVELSGVEGAVLTGGASPNRLDASAFSGPVVLRGFGGNDTLIGGSGNNTLDGGAGDDTLIAGDDRFNAPGLGSQANVLQGGGGSNLLLGGDGDDTLRAGLDGTAVLLGGAGTDTIIITNPAGTVLAPAGGFVVDGGGQAGDTLRIEGGGGPGFNQVYFAGPDSGGPFDVAEPNSLGFTPDDPAAFLPKVIATVPRFDGRIVTTDNFNRNGPTVHQQISFTGLGTIVDSVVANRFDVLATAAAPIVVLPGTDLALGRLRLTVGGGAFPAIDFLNKTVPSVRAADGTILVGPPILAIAAPPGVPASLTETVPPPAADPAPASTGVTTADPSPDPDLAVAPTPAPAAVAAFAPVSAQPLIVAATPAGPARRFNAKSVSRRRSPARRPARPQKALPKVAQFAKRVPAGPLRRGAGAKRGLSSPVGATS